ncbi:hypothetical protein DID88_009210 [Monilinia fructigena]|uniref:Sphingolipid long chain base-responsive protein PIL1 n=1 Tax=Monilinia fructigena TaxID=38457 RepID=A0A395IKK3_9HELO|nr:hypothetical protein DID88_009210 [Monilinia fructigena]
MHRTYSMRQSRAPTASQLKIPLHHHRAQNQEGSLQKRYRPCYANLRHTSALNTRGPELSKKLGQLVKMEKNVMRSMELVGRERMEVAQQLSIWGEGCDEDVSDVTDKLGVLLYEIGELEDHNVDRYDQYRVTIKSIRNIEASVQPSRDRKQKITDQIAQLKYKEPESPRIVVLEQELVRAEAESLVAEAQLSNITREKLKAAYTYQLMLFVNTARRLLLLLAMESIFWSLWMTLLSPPRNALGHDLTGQDQPLNDNESGLWVPAAVHKGEEYEDEEEEEEIVHSHHGSVTNGEQRGRQEELAI